MNIVEEKWPEIIERLRVEHEIAQISYTTWIKPLKIYTVSEDTVFIMVNMMTSLDYIRRKYLLPFKVCIAEITGIEYEVEFVSEDDLSLPEKSHTYNKGNEEHSKQSLLNQRIEEAHLLKKYTFDTFVVGKNNEFAHAASLAVAESPGEVYNPLFIYGGVGLGKTHLMHSVARFILENDPNKKVLYVTSEVFTNDLIDAIKKGNVGNESAMSEFRNKYRTNDVLLIDDIQFIIGKESTQEEFFHTFNHLHMANKQIIISSDKPPKDIDTLESRLRTRFEWGLIADISKPDYETRMAILRKKIDLDHLDKYSIPDDVLQYVAQNIKSNIRELEGSLNKIVAYSIINKNNGVKREIDIHMAAEAIKDMINPDDHRKVTPELIFDVVSEHFSVSSDDLKGRKRNREITIPRQVIMYLCREMTDVPLKEIGVLLGGKDHSTISYGIEKMEEDIKNDEALSNTIQIITKKINPI